MVAPTLDPSTGPVPRDKFRELINAPCGEAVKIIRQYDPLWGIPAGKKIMWRVDCRRTRIDGLAYVEASSEKEAQNLADDLAGCEVDWDTDEDDFEILSVKPDLP